MLFTIPFKAISAHVDRALGRDYNIFSGFSKPGISCGQSFAEGLLIEAI